MMKTRDLTYGEIEHIRRIASVSGGLGPISDQNWEFLGRMHAANPEQYNAAFEEGRAKSRAQLEGTP